VQLVGALAVTVLLVNVAAEGVPVLWMVAAGPACGEDFLELTAVNKLT
jgi:hypothetical protein